MSNEISLERPVTKQPSSPFVKGNSLNAVVLLSSSVNSVITLYWTAKTFRMGTVTGYFIDYDQPDIEKEMLAVTKMWAACKAVNKNLTGLRQLTLPMASKIIVPSMRNAIFVSFAAQHLLTEHPGGYVVLGTRVATGDGSNVFTQTLTEALTNAAGVPVNVISPLNSFAPTEEKTQLLALGLPGCMDAIKMLSEE